MLRAHKPICARQAHTVDGWVQTSAKCRQIRERSALESGTKDRGPTPMGGEGKQPFAGVCDGNGCHRTQRMGSAVPMVACGPPPLLVGSTRAACGAQDAAFPQNTKQRKRGRSAQERNGESRETRVVGQGRGDLRALLREMASIGDGAWDAPHLRLSAACPRSWWGRQERRAGARLCRATHEKRGSLCVQGKGCMMAKVGGAART